MRALGVSLVAVLVVAVIYVWNARQGPGEGASGADSTQLSSPATAVQTEQDSVVDSESQPQASTMAGTEPAADVSDGESDKMDPFRVVESAPNTELEILEPAVNPTENEESLPVAEATANTNQKVVQIPAGGYPVEDAMKYFVPKHERGPGNLGGPPPPAFMVPENAEGVRSIEALIPPAPGSVGQ